MEPAQFLQVIAEFTSDIISAFTPDWKCIMVSPSCKNILGYEPKELIGKSIYENMYPEDLTRILQNTKNINISAKTQILSYRIKHKDGVYVWLETTFHHVGKARYEDKPLMIIAVSKDITTRKNSDEMVKKFVEGVQYASDCIVMTNPDGQIMYVNPAVKEITGYSPEEIVGKHANVIWGGQSDNNEIVRMWDMLLNQKKAYRTEVSNLTKSGVNYFTDVNIAPIFDQNKDILFFVGISRDITKAKEVDRMKNEFISLASHQLRTPLTAIKWRLEMLMDKTFETLSGDQKRYVTEIDKSNERMIELVNSLLNISRIESGKLIIEPKETSLEALMMSTLDDLEDKVKEKNIKIKLSFQTNVYDVNVDPRLIRNVYMNLLSNAIKYTPKDGNVEIAIYIEGDNVITKIQDTGYGIPKADQAKVFNKFFRGENIKKIETEGTGLGLYLVKAIIEASGGKVWFESEQDKGTTFWISLNIHGTEAKPGEVTISD